VKMDENNTNPNLSFCFISASKKTNFGLLRATQNTAITSFVAVKNNLNPLFCFFAQLFMALLSDHMII